MGSVEFVVEEPHLLLAQVLVEVAHNLAESREVQEVVLCELHCLKDLGHIEVLLVEGDLEPREGGDPGLARLHPVAILTVHFVFGEVDAGQPNPELHQELGEVIYADHPLPIRNLLVQHQDVFLRHVLLDENHHVDEVLLSYPLGQLSQNFVQVDVFRVQVDSQGRHQEIQLRCPLLVLKVLLELVVENRVQKYLLPVEPFAFLLLQTPQNEVLHVVAYLHLPWKHYLPRRYFLPEPFLRLFRENPRNPPHQHLVSHHPQRPNVALVRVPFLIQDLRSHVAGSSH